MSAARARPSALRADAPELAADNAHLTPWGAHGLLTLEAQLLAHDLHGDFVHFTRLQLAEMKGSVGHTNEPRDFEAQMLHEALHLAVLAFAQSDHRPGIDALAAFERCLDRPIFDAVNRDARLQPVEIGLSHLAEEAHAIAPEPSLRGQFQLPREASVIGEEQQAFRVDVQPSDRHHARHVGGQALETVVRPFSSRCVVTRPSGL